MVRQSRLISVWQAWKVWLATRPVTASAQLVGYTLIRLFDEAHWPQKIKLSNRELMCETSSRNSQAMRAGIKALADAGVITVVDKGDRHNAAEYSWQLFSIEAISGTSTGTDFSTPISTPMGAPTGAPISTPTGTGFSTPVSTRQSDSYYTRAHVPHPTPPHTQNENFLKGNGSKGNFFDPRWNTSFHVPDKEKPPRNISDLFNRGTKDEEDPSF